VPFAPSTFHRSTANPQVDLSSASAVRSILQVAAGAEIPRVAEHDQEAKMGAHYRCLTFEIDGLTCGGGGALIAEHALARLPGVIRVYVNPFTEMAYVEIDPDAASEQQLVAAVADLGLRPGRPVAR
jgi:copper chaperone CopZ